MPATLMRHRIFDTLRRDILSCNLQPGAEVREGELALRFGVSKTPIRDALQKLELEGLIEIVPRQGHRVAPISVADASDILDLRRMLEAGALRHIVASSSDRELGTLDKFRTTPIASMKDFARYNRDFHFRLCRLSGNMRLAETMRRLMDNYERLCIVSLSGCDHGADKMAAALADHVEIIDALQARDVRTALRVSARHSRTSHRQIMRGLASRPIVG